MSEFKKVGLVTRLNDLKVSDTLNDVHARLESLGREILLDHSTRGLIGGLKTVGLDVIARECDLAVVIGGDGTLLHTARELADSNVPIVGVNRGRLGFLVDVSPESELTQLDEILAGHYCDEERFLLDVEVSRDGEVIHEVVAFNDIVLRVKDLLRIVEFKTYINGSFVNVQRADGVIVSTPSGSTAYSLSNGGPIVTPTLDVIVLQPICPHTLSSRPLVVGGGSDIEIRISDEGIDNGQLISDGQVYFDIISDDLIHVKQHRKRVRLIHPINYNYYKLLRAKLNWT
ncbi:MAG: NAD(+) kinase [Pseudomonadota bacterium]